MPELPDVQVLVNSMNEVLPGRRIKKIREAREVCLNTPLAEFTCAIEGKKIQRVWRRGKWAIVDLDQSARLAISLGMGGEVRYNDDLPEMRGKLAFVFDLDNEYILAISFWWFGNVFAFPNGDLSVCSRIGKLGPDALSDEMTLDAFRKLMAKSRGAIKPMLLNQKRIAGIGNVYVQEILYESGIHPERMIASLTDDDVTRLYHAMVAELENGIKYAGGPGERDVYGREGTYWNHTHVGYRDGKPCPRCNTTIERIRVGATLSFICPQCQPPP